MNRETATSQAFEVARTSDWNLSALPPKAYTIKEAAFRLRMSEKSVRRQIDRGNLRRCAKFGRVLIPAKDVDTFFDRFS
jgi:excisionase family DNA binding protein